MDVVKFLPFIGIAILLYVLSTIDLARVAHNFLTLDLLYFGVALGVLALTILVKTLKWKALVNAYDLHYRFGEALRAWLIGFSVSIVTPGKIGDFVRSSYLVGKTQIGKSLTTVLADRLIDIFVLFVLSIVGSVFFALYVQNTFLLTVTVILFALFLALVFLFSHKRVSRVLLKPFYRLLSAAKQEKIKVVYDDVYLGAALIRKKKKAVGMTLLLTFFSWGLSIVYFYLLALSLHLPLSLGFLFMIMPMVTLILILPISFSGAGTREFSLIFFLSFAHIEAELAVSFSLLILFMDYLLGFVGFFLWFRHPMGMKELRSAFR